MATIKDVAALAGISYTTVSHVVNKTRPVSEEVRVKVEAAIKTLDYVPSAVARSLKAKTTATIGLLVFVVREYSDLHWPSMLIGLGLALQAGFLAFWKKS